MLRPGAAAAPSTSSRKWSILILGTAACAPTATDLDTATVDDKRDLVVLEGDPSTTTSDSATESCWTWSAGEYIQDEWFEGEFHPCVVPGKSGDAQISGGLSATWFGPASEVSWTATSTDDAEAVEGMVAPPAVALPFPFVGVYDEPTNGVNWGCSPTQQLPQTSVIYTNHTDVTHSVWVTFPIPAGHPTQLTLQTWYQQQVAQTGWIKSPYPWNTAIQFALTGTEPTGALYAFCYAQVIQTNNPFATTKRERTATQHVPPGYTVRTTPYPMTIIDVNGIRP